MNTDEAARRLSNRDKVAQLLRDRPEVWLPAVIFEGPGGRQAWRSRISDCRTQLGMVIDNRERRVVGEDGSIQVCSEYRYVAARPEPARVQGQLSMFTS